MIGVKELEGGLIKGILSPYSILKVGVCLYMRCWLVDGDLDDGISVSQTS